MAPQEEQNSLLKSDGRTRGHFFAPKHALCSFAELSLGEAAYRAKHVTTTWKGQTLLTVLHWEETSERVEERGFRPRRRLLAGSRGLR